MQPEPTGFTGKEGDHEVGLVYFGERHLMPRIGRWASPDPLHVHAMDGEESLNSYHYVAGNLLQSRDPLGLTIQVESRAEGQRAARALREGLRRYWDGLIAEVEPDRVDPTQEGRRRIERLERLKREEMSSISFNEEQNRIEVGSGVPEGEMRAVWDRSWVHDRLQQVSESKKDVTLRFDDPGHEGGRTRAVDPDRGAPMSDEQYEASACARGQSCGAVVDVTPDLRKETLENIVAHELLIHAWRLMRGRDPAHRNEFHLVPKPEDADGVPVDNRVDAEAHALDVVIPKHWRDQGPRHHPGARTFGSPRVGPEAGNPEPPSPESQ